MADEKSRIQEVAASIRSSLQALHQDAEKLKAALAIVEKGQNVSLPARPRSTGPDGSSAAPKHHTLTDAQRAKLSDRMKEIWAKRKERGW